LFIIFINDLPNGLLNICRLYADDTKLIGIIKKEEDIDTIQNDIYRLQEWAHTWQMEFNLQKCKTMHFGGGASDAKYDFFMKNKDQSIYALESTSVERDLGIMISNDLKWAKQVENATKNANSIIARIRNTFSYFDSSVVKLLYTSFVRPFLEFAIPVWNPYLRKDIDALEKVQRRMTRLDPKLREVPYEERLKSLNLTTHEIRRERGDLIQYYKVLNNMDNINWYVPPVQVDYKDADGAAKGLRNPIKQYSQFVKNCQPRDKFFTNRIVDLWNRLPSEIKNVDTVNKFKAGLDSFGYFKVNGC